MWETLFFWSSGQDHTSVHNRGKREIWEHKISILL